MKKKKPVKIVMKFGGTSVGTTSAIQQVYSIVSSSQETVAGVVVSAFGGVTNQLIKISNLARDGNKRYEKIYEELALRHENTINELIRDSGIKKSTLAHVQATLTELKNTVDGVFKLKKLPLRTLDTILSFGERLSAYIISVYFSENGTPSHYVDASKLVETDDNFGAAQVHYEKSFKKIKSFYLSSRKNLKIITGYIASSDKGILTTLGRGGSDNTASIFGAALNVSRIEIWTDVDGIMTANPKKVKNARTITHLSYQEAMELSHFGAGVIFLPTMIPALKYNIPLSIRNTFNPKSTGSLIGIKNTDSQVIKGISSIDDATLFLIQGSGLRGTPGIGARLFGALAMNNVNVIFVTMASSEYTVCFAIEPQNTEKAKRALEKEFFQELKEGLIDPLEIQHNLSIVAIVGDQMRKTLGVAGKLFTTLARAKIEVVAIAQGSSERNISFVVERKNESKTLNTLHSTFFEEPGLRKVHIYLVGTGLIGGTLLEQLHAHNLPNRKDKIHFQIVGLANSKKMVFDRNGIDLSAWRESLDGGKKMILKKFIQTIKNDDLKDSIFVDCTANEGIAKWYPAVLKSRVAIVTPNKKANSGNLSLYNAIRKETRKAHSFFLYETNVCAGLPTIETISDLVATGDEIHMISGVFSGTLSYIYNNFTGVKRFSEVVEEAREQGYTEPDPREDLNGLDVARKLLILAREAGLDLELKDIEIENLVPEQCRKAKTIEEFFKLLKTQDSLVEKRKKSAEKDHKRLRYIGRIDVKNRKLSCKLEAVDINHPFYSLSGSDNIVSISTKRYNKTPMVIKGPGAGAEVTADGVFADILKIGKFYAYKKFKS